MPTPSDTAPLRPPASVVKIIGFLADVRTRLFLGGSLDLNQAWAEHDIAVNHVDSFLDWLNADRSAKPPREKELAKPPERSLAKKPDEEALAEGSRDGAEEPAVNIHLWNALFRPESSRRRRELPKAPHVATTNRATGFAQGYNGNYMLATLALTHPDLPQQFLRQLPASAERELDPESTEAAAEVLALREAPMLRNGLVSHAFGRRVADRAEGIAPLWNEPLRRNLIPDFGLPDMEFKPGSRKEPEQSPEVADPLYGQVTLIAPPFIVSPDREQGADVGLKFDWRDIAKGTGQVDYSGMRTLAKTLPEGAQVLYPAIDPRKLRGGAVNLKLEPRFAVDLAQAGYGNQVRVDGRRSARLAADWYGGTPPVRLLPATIAQLPRFARRASESPLGKNAGDATGALPAEPNRRMRLLDFLGLPVFFSPQLNTSPDLEQETRARVSTPFAPRSPIISPMQFSNLRSSMLGGFYGVDARPTVGGLKGGGPDLGAASLALSGLLARGLPKGLGEGVGRIAAPASAVAGRMPMLGAVGGAMAGFGAPGLAMAGMAMPSLSRPAPMSIPSLPGGPSGAPAAAEVPRFIRHDPGSIASRAPTPFRPTIPAMPQTTTSPRGQSASAPQPAGTSTTRVSPQFNIATERQPAPAKSIPAKQSMPSAPPSPQPAPMEGSKPERTPMVPQAVSPRPTTPLTADKMKPMPAKSAQPMLPDAPGKSGGLKPPSMLVAPAKAVPALKADQDQLAIQTSTAAPAGATGESAATRSAEVAEKKESGLPGSEINLLASEVWVLLKRRLSFEAQRMGK